MTDETVLNLSEVDPADWHVLVNGTVYGPYTLGQMQGFIRERRVGSRTQVAHGQAEKFKPAAEQAALASMFETGSRPIEETEAEPANYLIAAHLSGTGEMQMMGALNRLGTFAEVMPGVWILRSKARQSRVRARLQETVGQADQVMIANATTGRLAWLNLGPEADVHIRQVWDAKLDEG